MPDERPEQAQVPPPLHSHVPNLEQFLQELYLFRAQYEASQTVQQLDLQSAIDTLSNAISVVSVAVGGGGISVAGTANQLSLAIAGTLRTFSFTDPAVFTSAVRILGSAPGTYLEANFNDALNGYADVFIAGGANPKIDLYVNAATGIGSGVGIRLDLANRVLGLYNTGLGWAIDRADVGAHLYPNTDQTADLGKAAQRPRDVYVGRNLQVSGTISAPTIDTLSNAISVLSQQVSVLSQQISVHSQQISVLSQQISVLSQGLSVVSNAASNALSVANAASNAASVVSVAAANATSIANAVSAKADTLSNQISVLSQQVSVISQQVSVLSQAISVLSQQISVLSQQISVLSQAVSVLSQAVSVLSAAGKGISIVPTPSGRLTLTSATPVMTAQVLSAVKIFYTPYLGNALPIFDGTAWQLSVFSELEMSLDTSVHVSSTAYDVFAVNDAGTRRIVTGPAWATISTRGTGLNTTELQQKNGIWTNKNVVSAMRYGSLAVSAVAANTATYLGTFRTTGAPGQTEYSFGSLAASAIAANLLLWNMYNRVDAAATVQDSNNSWTWNPGVGTWRAADGSATMRINMVRGLDEDAIIVVYNNNSQATATSNDAIGIGVDSTTAYSGITGINLSTGVIGNMVAMWFGLPGLGFHFVAAIEWADGTGGNTYYGDDGLPTFIQFGLIGRLRT